MVAGAGLAPATSWLCVLLQLSLLRDIHGFVVWTVPSPVFAGVRQPVSTPFSRCDIGGLGSGLPLFEASPSLTDNHPTRYRTGRPCLAELGLPKD